MKGLLYILLLMISPEIFAGIFDPPPTDESMSMLGLIFGSNIGNVYLGGLPNPIMSAIMERFNFIIVTAGSIVVSYVVILSVINTAQEGSAMGKKWSAIWVPMRSIIGMTLMIPSPGSGYSLIQVTIIWIIVQGIGAADQIWSITLEGLKTGASATIGAQLDPNSSSLIDGPATNMTHTLLAVAICMEGLKEIAKTGNHDDNGGDWLHNNANYIKDYTTTAVATPNMPSINPSNPTKNVEINGDANFGINDPNDPIAWHKTMCGQIHIRAVATDSDFGTAYFSDKNENERFKILSDSAQLIYDTKQLAISSMLGVLQPLAESIVDGTVKTPTSTKTQLDPQGYKNAAKDAYKKLMSGLIVPVQSADLQDDLNKAIKIGEQKGWIVAGSYYFLLNRTLTQKYFTDNNIDTTRPEVLPIAPYTCNLACANDLLSGKAKTEREEQSNYPLLFTLQLPASERQELYKYWATGSVYLQNDFDPKETLDFSSSLAGGNEILKALTAPINGLVQKLATTMSGSGDLGTRDVLLAHSLFGRDMMLSMEITWLSIVGMLTVMGVGAAAAGFFSPGPGATFLGFILTVLSMVLPLIALVWTIGAGLAIYAPLIPFMIFTAAALGWLLIVIEAVIAAPIIALGLVTPAGDELGKLETALMILSNIFLRPMLMIFGFLLAGRLYNAVVSLIDLGMIQVFNTVNVQTLFSSILILFAYAGFVIGMTNTCFSLIYAVPDKIMRWIGGHTETTDISSVQQTKGAFSSAAKEVGHSGEEMAGMGAKKGQEGLKSSAEAHSKVKK